MIKIFLRGLRKLGVLSRIILRVPIVLNGKRFLIPIINGVGIDNAIRINEPWILFIWKRLITDQKDDSVIIDVGMNLGQTLLRVKSVHDKVRYVGFEPNSACFNYVNQLARVNKLVNYEIVPVGLSDKTEILSLRFFQNTDVDTEASVVSGFRDEKSVRKVMNVPVFSFNALSHLYKAKIGIIKIDVEGAELNVIKGMLEKIKEDRPYIILEVLPSYSIKNIDRIDRQNKIVEILQNVEYSILRIIKDGYNYQGVKEVEDFGLHSDINMSDYVLCPNEFNNDLKSILAH